MNPAFNPKALVGKQSAAAYQEILLRHITVQSGEVFHYAAPPKLQQRVALNSDDQKLIDQALQLRESVRLPFWEALFSTCLVQGRCSDALLSGAFFHNGQGVAHAFRREELEVGLLENLGARQHEKIALGSKVLCVGEAEMHLGLLDFHCEISPANTHVVCDVCRYLMPGGFLVVDSGDSYHSCSLTLQTPSERVAFLGKALLVNPIVDAQYIAHQLQQPSSSIRISIGGKAQRIPTVISAWTPN